MEIAVVEPFYSGSHRLWADQLQKHSTLNIKLLTLPGRHWKWRMQSAAFPLAEKANQMQEVDLYLCTDMLNIAEFRSFLKGNRKDRPIFLYMHENQMTYPWSPNDEDIAMERDHTYGMINIKSCLNADQLFFNSKYHLQSFFSALPSFLQKFPDSYYRKQIGSLKDKSQILSIGIDLPAKGQLKSTISDPPVILWNHRWEFDKGPDEFFHLLTKIQEKGIDFKLIVCGASGGRSPNCFLKAKTEFRENIIHWGYAESRKEYAKLVHMADVLPVTSYQDFFGISTIEAIAYGNYPFLPHRLAYPEHIPVDLHEQHLYNSSEELLEKMIAYLNNPQAISSKLIQHIETYDWKNMIVEYDAVLNSTTSA